MTNNSVRISTEYIIEAARVGRVYPSLGGNLKEDDL